MNCDLVFDLLTRGPVPAGDAETDAAVDRHLAACHECRRLAEAMRPAVDLFHESISDPESLPCYRGSLPVVAEFEAAEFDVAAADVAVADIAVLERPTSTKARERRAPRTARSAVWPFVAVSVTCVMLGAGLMSLRDARRRDVPDTATTALRLVDEVGERRLVALGTTDDCRPRFAVAGTQGHLLQCCSLCHAAGSSAPTAEPVAVAKSCVVCHTSVPGSDDTDQRFDVEEFEASDKLL